MSYFQPRDLSIILNAASSPSQVLNGGPKGATFPGWFLRVTQNEGYDDICGPLQLSSDNAIHFAKQVDKMIGFNRVVTVETAVLNCDLAMRTEIRRQLKVAEQAAARIPELKRLLGEE